MEVAHATLWRAGSDAGARPLPFADRAFDVVVSHLTLSHLACAAHVVAEVFRVLRPRGTFAVFDGTYTLATPIDEPDEPDPLHACLDAWKIACAQDHEGLGHLPLLAKRAGFHTLPFHRYGAVAAPTPTAFLAVVAQGATTLVDTGRISLELATALIREAHRRVEVGASFGQIVYTSLTAQKPGPSQARRLPQGATRARRDGTAF